MDVISVGEAAAGAGFGTGIRPCVFVPKENGQPASMLPVEKKVFLMILTCLEILSKKINASFIIYGRSQFFCYMLRNNQGRS